MTSKEISLHIVDACKASAELNYFMIATYAKPLTYARGLNLDVDYYSENKYEDVPIIIIDPEKNTIESDTGNTFAMVLHIKVAHEGEFKDGFDKVNSVITLAGIDEVEAIGGFIQVAIQEKFSTLLEIQDMEMYLDPLAHVSNFTEYNGHIVITFFEEVNIGCSI